MRNLIVGKVHYHKVIIPDRALRSCRRLALNLADSLGWEEAETSFFPICPSKSVRSNGVMSWDC